MSFPAPVGMKSRVLNQLRINEEKKPLANYGFNDLCIARCICNAIVLHQESYKLKSELFDQNVSSALNAVINKVQKQNAFLKINKKRFRIKKRKRSGNQKVKRIPSFPLRSGTKKVENLRKFKQQQEVIDYLNFQDSIIRETYFNPQIISEEQFRTYSNKSTDNSRKLSLEVVDIKDKKNWEFNWKNFEAKTGAGLRTESK